MEVAVSDIFTMLNEQGVLGPAGHIQVASAEGAAEGPFSGTQSLAVICHPHPLFGGTMDNKVVTTLARAYRDLGIHAVRFNFRGVGESAGEHDNAIGEVDDLLAVTAWLKEQLPQHQLLLAGFSFGSSIAAQASFRMVGVKHLSLVAPPVTRYPYAVENKFPVPLCVLQGDKDEQVEAAEVVVWAEALTSAVEYHSLVSAGHFFHGHLPALKRCIETSLSHQYSPHKADARSND